MIVNRLLTPASISVTVIGLLLTYFTYPPNGYLTLAMLKYMAGPITTLALPSVLFGIFVSGNIHQPDPMATCVALFVTYLLLIRLVGWLALATLKKLSAR